MGEWYHAAKTVMRSPTSRVAWAVGVMKRARYEPRREFLYGSRLAKWITAADAMGGGRKCVTSPTTRSRCQKK